MCSINSQEPSFEIKVRESEQKDEPRTFQPAEHDQPYSSVALTSSMSGLTLCEEL